jgi:hypothetical protein
MHVNSRLMCADNNTAAYEADSIVQFGRMPQNAITAASLILANMNMLHVPIGDHDIAVAYRVANEADDVSFDSDDDSSDSDSSCDASPSLDHTQHPRLMIVASPRRSSDVDTGTQDPVFAAAPAVLLSPLPLPTFLKANARSNSDVSRASSEGSNLPSPTVAPRAQSTDVPSMAADTIQARRTSSLTAVTSLEHTGVCVCIVTSICSSHM